MMKNVKKVISNILTVSKFDLLVFAFPIYIKNNY